MINALLICVALSRSGPGKLPSYEEVEKGVFAAARKLKNYSDEWTVDVGSAGSTATQISAKRKIDGKRFCFEAFLNGNRYAVNAHDGLIGTMVFDAQKVFGQGYASNELFKQSWEDGKPEPMEKSGSKFLLQEYDIQCIAEPQFAVTSFDKDTLDKVPVRKLVATSENSLTGARRTLTVWFEPDRWIMRQFKIDTVTTKGNSTDLGVRKWVNEKNKFTGADFKPDVSGLTTYQRMTIDQLRGG